jgi:hypothetical protein
LIGNRIGSSHNEPVTLSMQRTVASDGEPVTLWMGCWGWGSSWGKLLFLIQANAVFADPPRRGIHTLRQAGWEF